MLLLLRYDASSSLINGTAQIPKDMTEDDEIITMLEGMKGLAGFFSLPLSQSCRSCCFPGLITVFALHSRREKRDTAAGGEVTGSGQRRRPLRSV